MAGSARSLVDSANFNDSALPTTSWRRASLMRVREALGDHLHSELRLPVTTEHSVTAWDNGGEGDHEEL